jgi:hypothetical protein
MHPSSLAMVVWVAMTSGTMFALGLGLGDCGKLFAGARGLKPTITVNIDCIRERIANGDL